MPVPRPGGPQSGLALPGAQFTFGKATGVFVPPTTTVVGVVPGVQQTFGFTSVGPAKTTVLGPSLQFVTHTVGGATIKTGGIPSTVIGLTGPGVQYTSPAKTPGQPQGKPLDFTLVLKELKATRYLSWLQKSGALQYINDGGFYTIFVPSDEAIGQISGQLLSKLESDTVLLRQLVLYHIVVGDVSIDNDSVYPTLDEGSGLRFNKYFNGKVITASGGVIGTRKQQGNFVFYTVDRVLHRPGGSILDVVHQSILLPKLDEAIKFAGLEEYLSGAGPYTLFAPSDKAFKNAVGMENVLRDREALKALLLRHIVLGTVYSAGVQENQVLKTVGGLDLTMRIIPECITVNGVNVNNPDNVASNGVIHVIDHFL